MLSDAANLLLRKSVLRVASGFLIFVISAFVFLAIWPGDVVTTKYASVFAARDNGLFSRGWLPDVLPVSARNIRVSNNLDLGTSEGEFVFNARDADILKEKLVTDPIPHAPFKNWERYMERKRNTGFEIAAYSDKTSSWLFLCRYQRGECEYVMWSTKP